MIVCARARAHGSARSATSRSSRECLRETIATAAINTAYKIHDHDDDDGGDDVTTTMSDKSSSAAVFTEPRADRIAHAARY